MRMDYKPASLHASLAIMLCVLRFEASRCPRAKSARPVPVCLLHQVFDLGFVAQPRNPMILWWTTTNLADLVCPPRQSHSWLGIHGRPGLVLALRLNQGTVHDFVLLFLPPCGPLRIPSATGSLEPSLLVSPHLKGHRHRPFALVLHMYQRKSSRNLHL
jgi:hypothetical protein